MIQPQKGIFEIFSKEQSNKINSFSDSNFRKLIENIVLVVEPEYASMKFLLISNL